jgi:adenylate kinase family enzyme
MTRWRPSGSGKTTLAELLAAHVIPCSFLDPRFIDAFDQWKP